MLKIPSVNQLNAQTKLLQVWKSQQSESYPIQWVKRNEAILDKSSNLYPTYLKGY